jgi:hypothetical protein
MRRNKFRGGPVDCKRVIVNRAFAASDEWTPLLEVALGT